MFGQVELLELIMNDSFVDETETLQANYKGDHEPNLNYFQSFVVSPNQSTLEMPSKSFNLCPMKNATYEPVNLHSAHLNIFGKFTNKDLQQFVSNYHLALQNYIWFFLNVPFVYSYNLKKTKKRQILSFSYHSKSEIRSC